MEQFTLKDIDAEIELLQEQNKEIIKKIEGLVITRNILNAKKPTNVSEDYVDMKGEEACLTVIEKHPGLKSNEVIDLIVKGGSTYKVSSLNVMLSNLVKANKVRIEKEGGYNIYYPI